MAKSADPRDEIVRVNLKKFREEAGLIQAEAAELSGIPIDNLRRYENGVTSNVPSARAAAGQAGGPSSVLPPNQTRSGCGSRDPRSSSGGDRESQQGLEDEAQKVGERRRNCVDVYGLRSILRAVSTSDGDVAEIAGTLRALSLQFEPPYSTTRILEVVFPDAIVIGHNLPDGVDEAVSTTPCGPVIVHQPQASTDRRRVAEAHAIAHLVFDLDARVVGGDREARADAFALELLAPDHEMREFVDQLASDVSVEKVDAIATRFGVPIELLGERIRKLDD